MFLGSIYATISFTSWAGNFYSDCLIATALFKTLIVNLFNGRLNNVDITVLKKVLVIKLSE